MSRNKIIKMVHDFTGLSYKQCRALCKYHHWNKNKLTVVALTYDADTLGNLKEACNNLYAAFFEAGAKIAEGLAVICDNWAEAMRDQSERFKQCSNAFAPLLSEVRKQFEAELIDVNDPHMPVFAPYYASTAGNGKLYQNDGGRNTDETGA